MGNIGIIGAGIGGISLSIRLACQNEKVEIFEKNEFPGGKLSSIQKDGFRYDAGPSLFTLPTLVDELFTLAGKNPRDYFNYQRLPEICKYFWEDGTRLSTLENPTDTAEEMASQLGEDKELIIQFLAGLKHKYEIISDLFLGNSLHELSTWTSKKAMKGYANIPSLGLFSKMHQYHTSLFKNPKTVQLFDRYATYNGSDPYQTPATLSIIPHLEYNIGAFFPEGGMISITKALYQLAIDLGVTFHFNTAVEKILLQENTAVGLKTSKGEFRFDAIASNSDIRPSYLGLLSEIPAPKKLLNQEKSSSGIIFYWGMNKNFDELGVHNIFFSDNYRSEFDAIFQSKTLFEDPTVYIHISSKLEKTDAPPNSENWFVLINTPANEGQDWENLVKETKERVLDKVGRILGYSIREYLISEDSLDPIKIEQRTTSSGGALYGNASNNQFAAFLRHPNYRPAIKNLYWVGGSVHPGGGIPLCLSSAKIAADLYQKNAYFRKK
ncbi:1-hydroxycarotenoid 3,4-desaturase CrtD [Aquirufa sp. ROCK2-A2]